MPDPIRSALSLELQLSHDGAADALRSFASQLEGIESKMGDLKLGGAKTINLIGDSAKVAELGFTGINAELAKAEALLNTWQEALGEPAWNTLTDQAQEFAEHLAKNHPLLKGMGDDFERMAEMSESHFQGVGKLVKGYEKLSREEQKALAEVAGLTLEQMDNIATYYHQLEGHKAMVASLQQSWRQLSGEVMNAAEGMRDFVDGMKGAPAEVALLTGGVALLTAEISRGLDAQEAYSTAAFRSSGSIMEMVSAEKGLRAATYATSAEVRRTVQSFAQWGLIAMGTRGEIANLQKTNIQASAVMDVDQGVVTRLQRAHIGLGASVKQSDRRMAGMIAMQRQAGVSGARWAEVLSQIESRLYEVNALYGKGTGAGEEFEQMMLASTVMAKDLGTSLEATQAVIQRMATAKPGDMIVLLGQASMDAKGPLERLRAATRTLGTQLGETVAEWDNLTAFERANIIPGILGDIPLEEVDVLVRMMQQHGGDIDKVDAAWQKLIDDQKNAADVAKEYENKMSTLKGQAKKFWAPFREAFEDIRNWAIAAATEVASWLGWIAEKAPWLPKAVGYVIGLAAALKGLSIVIGASRLLFGGLGGLLGAVRGLVGVVPAAIGALRGLGRGAAGAAGGLARGGGAFRRYVNNLQDATTRASADAGRWGKIRANLSKRLGRISGLFGNLGKNADKAQAMRGLDGGLGKKIGRFFAGVGRGLQRFPWSAMTKILVGSAILALSLGMFGMAMSFMWHGGTISLGPLGSVSSEGIKGIDPGGLALFGLALLPLIGALALAGALAGPIMMGALALGVVGVVAAGVGALFNAVFGEDPDKIKDALAAAEKLDTILNEKNLTGKMEEFIDMLSELADSFYENALPIKVGFGVLAEGFSTMLGIGMADQMGGIWGTLFGGKQAGGGGLMYRTMREFASGMKIMAERAEPLAEHLGSVNKSMRTMPNFLDMVKPVVDNEATFTKGTQIIAAFSTDFDRWMKFNVDAARGFTIVLQDTMAALDTFEAKRKDMDADISHIVKGYGMALDKIAGKQTSAIKEVGKSMIDEMKEGRKTNTEVFTQMIKLLTEIRDKEEDGESMMKERWR